MMILFVDFHSVSIVHRIVLLLLSNHNVRAVRSNSAGRGLADPTLVHVSTVSSRVLQGRSPWRDRGQRGMVVLMRGLAVLVM